jgi:hypothetical protein
MRIMTGYTCLVLLGLATPLAAQPMPPAEDPAAELNQLIHKAVSVRLPKVTEDDTGWGRTIPLPDKLRLPRARRTIVEVNGQPEVPDGTWIKTRLSVADPDHDLQIHVRTFKRLSATSYRMTLDADVTFRSAADTQRWRNGLLLADATVSADMLVRVFLDCEVVGRLGANGVRLEPDVKDITLTLKEYTPHRVKLNRTGLTVEGDAAESLSELLKSRVEEQLRTKETNLKKHASESLAAAMKDSKNPLNAAAMLKAAAPLMKKPD